MYSIHVRNRPIKTAFLINPAFADWEEWFDAIWLYTQDKWGGRFSPIVPTDGESIDANWWKFLEELDPDYIYAVSPISERLTKELNSRLSPIDVILHRHSDDPKLRPVIHFMQSGLTLRPNPSNVTRCSRLLSNPFLAAISSDWWCPDKNTFRFLLRSFGTYQNTVFENSALEKVPNKEKFSVTTQEEIPHLLSDLRTGTPEGESKFLKDYIYPVQFSMMEKPNWDIDLDYKHSSEVFGIIVGDSFEEQLFYRNKVFYERDCDCKHINHIWLPQSFLQDPEIVSQLARWLRRITQRIHIFSFSRQENELQEFADRLICDGQFMQPLYLNGITKEFHYPEYTKHQPVIRRIAPPKNVDRYTGYGDKEHIEIRAPEPNGTVQETGHWIAEIFAEANGSRFSSFDLGVQTYWWQLPKKNYLVESIFASNVMFGKKARVDSSGVPCLLFSAERPTLKLRLPSDYDFLSRSLIQKYIFDSGSVRHSPLSVRPSNIGKYLNGFVEVFGKIDFAYQILSSRYWRNVFDILSKRNLKQDEDTLERIRNSIKKRLGEANSNQALLPDDLAPLVLALSRELAFESQTIEFRRLCKLAETEAKEYTERNSTVERSASENTLREYLSTMLERGIFQMGFQEKCPRCGVKTWFHIDRSARRLDCDGCQYQFSLRAEPQLRYKLNSLVHQGYALHGLTPVVLVLGQLQRESSSSFFYAPSLDVLSSDGGAKKQLGDLDIACISDGKLIIGEAKHRQSQFDEHQVIRLVEMARAVSPDIVIFAALDKNPSRRMQELIKFTQNELADTKIEVKWFELEPSIFEPDLIW